MAVELTWEGDLRFRAVGEARVEVVIDADTRAGLSPMEALLAALAGCMGSDIVDILRKGREELTGCVMRLSGTRREEPPRRYTAIAMEVELTGRKLNRDKAQRAIELSRTTYCSVWSSMAPDIDLDVTLTVRESS